MCAFILKVQSKCINVRERKPTKKCFMDLLNAIEQRLESQIDRKLGTIESELDALTPQIKCEDNDVGEFDPNCEGNCNVDFECHLENIQRTIKSISERVGGESRKKNDGEDRKRLKEKLKEAMRAENSKSSGIVPELETWMEYLFGICKPDGRAGKPGSRFVKEVSSKFFVLDTDTEISFDQTYPSTLPLYARFSFIPSITKDVH